MVPTEPPLMSLRDALTGRVLRGTIGVDYHLRACIGEGGQGWVFKANWDEPGGLVIIVKVLRPDAMQGETLHRFQREAQVLRMLSQGARPNPHIVRFFDHAVATVVPPQNGAPLTLPYTVLEYVNGPTLERALSTGRPEARGLPVERVRRIMRQVVQALEVVHGQKVVHRDLKPSNILLATEAGTEIAKVTDFGLVKLVDPNLQSTASLAGASLGYAPPEQYEQGNQRVSARTDVFSLAAILFEMLCGKSAFPYRPGENPLLILTRILNGPRPALMRSLDTVSSELVPNLDLIESIDEQIARATAADPNERHETVVEFWNQVEPCLRAALEPPRGSGPSRQRGALPFAATEPAFAASPDMRPSGEQPGSNPPPVRAPSQQRMRAVSDSHVENPVAWSWQIRIPSASPDFLHSVAFSPNGQRAVAVGPHGWARAEGGAWVSFPVAVDPRLVRALLWLGDSGEVLAIGERGLVARVAPSGAHELWPLPDAVVTFLGGHVDDLGLVTLVGERPARPGTMPEGRPRHEGTTGVVAQFHRGTLSLLVDVPSCTRLRGVARLGSGSLAAVGDWGVVARIERGVIAPAGNICKGHLHAIAPLPDGGALAIGAGGHALSLNARLEAQLEAVQTTRDLLCLTVGEDGGAWTGSARARLLRRTAKGWLRMNRDLGIEPDIIAVWGGMGLVRAACDDGAVFEGTLG